MKKLYVLIWGQCSDGVQSLLRLYPDFEDKANKFDGVWLLNIIEPLLAEIRSKKKICAQLIEKYLKFMLTHKYDNETVHDYMTHFKANLKALKLAGGDKVLCAETVMKLKWSDLDGNLVK